MAKSSWLAASTKTNSSKSPKMEIEEAMKICPLGPS